MSDFQRELLRDYERSHSKWDTFPILQDSETEQRDDWLYWHQAVHNNNYEPETAWYALDPD
jgi:hypothetical protein